MATKTSWRSLALAAVLAAGALFAQAASAQEIVLVTGEHWVKSAPEVKKAYLVGLANMAQLELAYQGAAQAPDSQSVLPRMQKGLRGQTLDSVREALDRWYAANPQRLQRPVLETVWFELVVPGLAKTN